MSAERYPEDIVADALKPDIDEDGRFEVTDHASANWALQKLRQKRRQHREMTEPKRRVLERLDAERDLVQKLLDDDDRWLAGEVEFFEGKIAAWLRALRLEDPETKSVKLIGGTVKSRMPKARVEIVDEETALLYAEEHNLTWRRVKAVVDKNELKRYVTSTGEEPPGVAFIQPDDDDFTVTITLDGDDQ